MITNAAEGNCCKDTQAFSRHDAELVTPPKYDFHAIKLDGKNKDKERCEKRNVKIESNKRNKKKFANAHKFKSQIGKENWKRLNTLVSEICKMAGIDLHEVIWREIEGLVALYYAAMGCSDTKSLCACLFLYIRTHFKGSVSSDLINYVRGTLLGYNSQVGDEDSCNDIKTDAVADGIFNTMIESVKASSSKIRDTDSWVTLLKDVRDNWASCRSHGLFPQLSKLLGLFVTFGICEVSNATFSIKDFKVLEPDIRIVHGNASDVIVAVMDTVIYFTENVLASMEKGSILPLIMGDGDMTDLDIEYATLCKYWELARCGNLERIENITDAEFNKRLESMATKLKSMLKQLKGFEKNVIDRKFQQILTIINDFSLIKLASGFRRAPFSIQFYGDSSVGKSTACEQLSNILLASAGLSTDKGRTFIFDPAKKFWDKARSDMLRFHADDHGNTKEKYVEKSPCETQILIKNNIPLCAPMAEIENKGRIWVEPELSTLTTNVLNLDAHTYSNCPYSIQRRMDIILEVKVRPEFALYKDGVIQGIDTEKVQKHYAMDSDDYEPAPYDDIWLFDVLNVIKPKDMRHAGHYEIATWNGTKMENVRFQTVIKYATQKFHKFRKQQLNLKRAHEQRSVNYEFCHVPDCGLLKCMCKKHLDSQNGVDRMIDLTCSIGKTLCDSFVGEISKPLSVIEQMTAFQLRSYAANVTRHLDWLWFVPTPWLQNDMFIKFFMCVEANDIYQRIQNLAYSIFAIILMVSSIALYTDRILVFKVCVVSFCVCLVALLHFYRAHRSYIVNYMSHRNTISPILQAYRDTYMPKLLAAMGIASTFYILARAYKKWNALTSQGSLEPESEIEVEERDNRINVWTKVIKTDCPIPVASKTVTCDQLNTIVQKNLVYGTVHIGEDNYMVNGLFLKSNVVLVPMHYFELIQGDSRHIDITFRKKNPDASGGKFVARLSLDAAINIPNTDMMVCYSSTGGSFKDLTKYFPLLKMRDFPFKLVYRKKDGELIHALGKAHAADIVTNVEFEGFKYSHLSINTFNGMCGAILVSDTRHPMIAGIHLGGHENTPIGCGDSFTQDQLNKAIGELRKIEGLLLTGSGEKFESQSFNKECMVKAPLHKKSPLNYLPHGSQFEYYGSCVGKTRYVSRVKVTPISEIVTDVCSVPNKWMAPKMNPDWYAWQSCLENMAVPAIPHEHGLLIRAVKDYKREVIPLFQSNLWRDGEPLTDKQNINGIPGKKFIDAINLATAIGFPLSGPKTEYVEDLEAIGEDGLLNRKFKQEVYDEINRCESLYKQGQRAFTIAKACKKDEVVSKEKCRIFYGNSIALTYLIRKYYLPVIRVLMMNPLKSECAVGINCHGPEWDTLYKHIMKFGENRLFGGDYGKYDQKMPSALIIAALRILIDCASHMKYTKQDLQVMESMVGDIVYSYIAFNGDLIGLTEGGHISGNSLTVVINSICGSLNFRTCFFSLYPNEERFAACAAMTTYGDDNIGTIQEGYENFNILSFSQFLAKYGQIYTMPDKNSEIVPFLKPDEFEFLKRKNVYHEALKCNIGALHNDSCFKMLHCYLRDKKSPLSENEACAVNIDTALREWFNHGRTIYEERRVQMREVSERAQISHMCNMLDTTYEDMVETWQAQYNAELGR